MDKPSRAADHVNDQDQCQSLPAAYLWRDAYKQGEATFKQACRTGQNELQIAFDTAEDIYASHTDTTVKCGALGVAATAFTAAAVVAESPVLIGAATLGAVGCGGMFIWTAAQPTIESLNQFSRQRPSSPRF
jgi:hypothetical protein